MSILGYFFFDFKKTDFNYLTISLIFATSIISLISNFLFYKGLHHTSIEKAEPLILSNWIFSIILAFLFFSSERNNIELILALISGITIVATFTEKHHLTFNKYQIYFLTSSFLLAFHAIIIKLLLEIFTPIETYFLRILLQFIFLIIIFRFTLKNVLEKKNSAIIISAIIALIMNIFTYWSYDEIGVISTSMILTLTPIIAILSSKIFLKENIHPKFLISTLIISSCILTSTIF
jgi:drug/metabolite transporter (DMT)-like permease